MIGALHRLVAGTAVICLTLSGVPATAQQSPAQIKAQRDRAAREAAVRAQAERERVASIAASARQNAARAEAERQARAKLPNLDRVIVFSDPEKCEMALETGALFGNLIKFDPPDYEGKSGPSVKLPGFGVALTPSFTRKVDEGPNRYVRDNEATLATAGIWHNLRVSKIRVRRLEESSFWEYQIRFLEPASHVRITLNGMGFNIPPIGDVREYTEDSVVSAGIGVEAIPGGSALTCGSSWYY